MSEPEKFLRTFSKEELKDVVKSAIEEWLDKQALKFGRWSIRWLGLAALGVLAYFILTTSGWKQL